MKRGEGKAALLLIFILVIGVSLTIAFLFTGGGGGGLNTPNPLTSKFPREIDGFRLVSSERNESQTLYCGQPAGEITADAYNLLYEEIDGNESLKVKLYMTKNEGKKNCLQSAENFMEGLSEEKNLLQDTVLKTKIKNKESYILIGASPDYLLLSLRVLLDKGFLVVESKSRKMALEEMRSFTEKFLTGKRV